MYIQITMGQAKFHIQQTPRIINRSKVRWPEFVEVISGRSFQQFILRFFRGIHAAYDLLPWSLGRSNWYFGRSAEAELLVYYGCVIQTSIFLQVDFFFWIEDNPISIIKRKYQSEQVGHENPDYRSGETENKFKLAGSGEWHSFSERLQNEVQDLGNPGKFRTRQKQHPR